MSALVLSCEEEEAPSESSIEGFDLSGLMTQHVLTNKGGTLGKQLMA